MIPPAPYRAWNRVIRFESHDPNRFESLAVVVALPHHRGSRAANVALTTVTIARRRFSRVMWLARTRRNAPSSSSCCPVDTSARIPMFVPSANRHINSRRRNTSFGKASLVATDTNSDVKSVNRSVFFSMSSRSIVPHRRATSALSAARFCGSGSFSNAGTVIHGCPFFVVIFTPPVVPLTIAVFSVSKAARWRRLRSSTNSFACRGLPSAA